MMKHLLTLFLLAAFFGCNTSKNAFYNPDEKDWQVRELPDSALLRHTVFMVGEAGAGKLADTSLALILLTQALDQAGSQSSVVFLGDNIPIFKSNPKKHKEQAAMALNKQLATVRNYSGHVVFLPGDADWSGIGESRCEAIKWQREYVEQALGKDKAFLPGNCCGEPVKLKINEDVRFLFADSEWWVRNEEVQEECSADARFGFIGKLEEELKKQEKDRIVLFMHHPLRSNGPHGGSFSWMHHLFPLTLWKEKAWVPLPGIGSLVVLFRKIGGNRQDLTSPELVSLNNELNNIITNSPRNESVICVGAHDQSLQLFSDTKGVTHHVVSGSAAQAGFARGGKDARFALAKQGFAKLYFYKNREAWIEFLALEKPNQQLSVVFRKKLFGGDILPTANSDKPISTLPDSVTIAASSTYKAGVVKKLTFGDRYRQAWETPVTAPVFNLNTEFKNFTPVGQGGGMSSKSMRLEDEKGRQYVLRSVDKDVGKGLPLEIRKTVVKDLIQDLKSGSHPYGAFVVPALANAAGIYHTNPRLFYLPRQERLGAYNDVFAEDLYLFEERPDEDWSDLPSFGNSADIIGYTDVLENIQKNHKHRVDQEWALKSRLFDQFIHDYDRHDDQWRWASFPQGDSLTVYRPVPRDRDQAFYDLRGIVPFVISRRWLALQQRGLRGSINDVPGEAYPGSVFDRSFLTELDRNDWLETANTLKNNLTDSVIENAFKIWPVQIYELNAPHIIKRLKERRDNIPTHAEKLYCFYARYVDVVGTAKQELFEVERYKSGDVEVSIFSLKKNGEKGDRHYHRLFKKDETCEVRLFGLGGDDVFRLSGEAGHSIHVRIIGGKGDDRTEDSSQTGGIFKKTTVYDLTQGMEIIGNVRDKRDNRLKTNAFYRNEFKYNRYFPLLNFAHTVDDGLLLGGGIQLTRYRFRKQPYGIQHRIFARFSVNTNALNLHYNGDFIRTVGNLDFNPDIRFDRPIIFNFFGLGNGTKDTALKDDFNWVRLEKMMASPLLKKSWYNGRNFTRFGPFFERVEVEDRAGRITDTAIFSQAELSKKHFLGFHFAAQLPVCGRRASASQRPEIPAWCQVLPQSKRPSRLHTNGGQFHHLRDGGLAGRVHRSHQGGRRSVVQR